MCAWARTQVLEGLTARGEGVSPEAGPFQDRLSWVLACTAEKGLFPVHPVPFASCSVPFFSPIQSGHTRQHLW